MIDIVPTILEATGIQAPVMVNGVAQKPIEGVSMAYTFDKANANAPSTRSTQYFEMFGNRAIYHDGWIAATTPPAAPWLMGTAKMPDDLVNGYKWELYNIAKDYSENNDWPPRCPTSCARCSSSSWWRRRNTMCFRWITRSWRVSLHRGRAQSPGGLLFTYSGYMPGVPYSDAPSILNKSYSITAEVDVPQGGAEGMLVTLGGRFGGYGLYVLKGKPVFTYNLLDLERFRWEGQQALTPGKHTIVFDFKYDGPGLGKGGSGVLSVDGKEVASKAIPHTIPIIMTVDETFDVGVDTRTPVDDKDYQVPFRFTGKLDKLTIKLGPSQLSKADQKTIDDAMARVND